MARLSWTRAGGKTITWTATAVELGEADEGDYLTDDVWQYCGDAHHYTPPREDHHAHQQAPVPDREPGMH